MDPRPRGRDAVQAAVIAAARRRFAAEGLAASLRDIASDAGVNLGLVHRHFGSKAALVSAVLADVAARGHTSFAGSESLDGALDVLIRAAATHDEGLDAYARMVGWMLLAGDDPLEFQEEFPAVSRVVELAGPNRRGIVLLVLAAAFGWEIFARHLTPMVGYPSEDAAAADLAALLRRAVASAAAP